MAALYSHWDFALKVFDLVNIRAKIPLRSPIMSIRDHEG